MASARRTANRFAPRLRATRRGIALIGALAVVVATFLVAEPFGVTRAQADGAPSWVSLGQLRYASAGGRSLWLDEYAPRVHAGRLAGVLVVHGGGWIHGSAAGSAELAEHIAAAGFAVFDVDYSLASKTRPGLSMQPEQIEAAVAWITRHARSLGLASGGIGALGSSAGGNLVARVALLPRERDLKAVVVWSGPMNLDSFAPMVEKSCRGDGCGSHWLATDLVDYVGCRPTACPARWSLASPLDQVRADAPPMLMFNSSHELIPLSGTLSFEARLRRDHDSARLIVYPGTRHAGAYGATALAPTIAFFRAELRSKAAGSRQSVTPKARPQGAGAHLARFEVSRLSDLSV